jgi:hypothetical protein
MKRNFKFQVIQMPGQSNPQSDPNTVDGEVVDGGSAESTSHSGQDNDGKPKAIKSGELLP